MAVIVIAAILGIGGLLVWSIHKHQEPALLGEVQARLRNHAQFVRQTAPLRAKDYEAMADAVDRGQQFARRGERPPPGELRHIQLHLAATSADNLLNQIGYHYGSPSQSRARKTIFGLMKRLDRNRRP